MKKLLPFALVFALVGCTITGVQPPKEPIDFGTPPVEVPTTLMSSSAAPEVVAPPAEVQTVTLVDQTFEKAAGVTGAARLSAMRTVKLKGSVRNASLTFTLSRNGQNEGVAGVMAYTGDLTPNGGGVLAETEWKRFRGVGAAWVGGGKCMMARGSELLSGKGETIEMTFPLNALPVTSTQPECTGDVELVNLESRLNDTGIALGFLPTNENYHLKVVLSYEGELTVKPW